MEKKYKNPVDVATIYLKAMLQGDFLAVTGMILPADILEAHQMFVDAADKLATIGEAQSFLKIFTPAGTLESIRHMQPVALLTSLIEKTYGSLDGLPIPEIELGSVKQDLAVVYYRYPTKGMPDDYATLAGERKLLKLTFFENRWWVRLHEGISNIHKIADKKFEAFQERVAQDKATFTHWTDLYPMAVDDEWGYMTRKGKIVISPRFRHAGHFVDGYAAVRLRGIFRVINHLGQFVDSKDYDELEVCENGLRVFAQKESWGLTDVKGKVIIPPEWEEVYPLINYDVCILQKQDCWQAFCFSSQQVFDLPDYPYFSLGGNPYLHDMNDNRIIPVLIGDGIELPATGGLRIQICFSSETGRFGFTGMDGTVHIPCVYEDAFGFCEGVARVRNQNLYGFIDESGMVLIEPTYEDAFDFHHGVAMVKENEEYFLINKEGHAISSDRYEDAGKPTRGLFPVTMDDWAAWIEPNSNVVWCSQDHPLMWPEWI